MGEHLTLKKMGKGTAETSGPVPTPQTMSGPSQVANPEINVDAPDDSTTKTQKSTTKKRSRLSPNKKAEKLFTMKTLEMGGNDTYVDAPAKPRSEVMAGVAHQRGGAGMQHGEQAAPQVMKSLSETITTLHPFLDMAEWIRAKCTLVAKSPGDGCQLAMKLRSIRVGILLR